MYTINAKTCSHPITEFSMRVENPEHAFKIANILVEGFHSVDMIDNETGEVMFSIYGSDTLFNLIDTLSFTTTPAIAIQQAMRCYEEDNC